jgi:hypothetical protein
MAVVHAVSFSRRALVAGVSAVTRTSPLLRLLAAMTLPGFPALALLMASTTRGLGCRGAASLLLLTVTSLRSLLGTNFSERARAAGAGVLTASAYERTGFAVFWGTDTLF